MAAAAPTGISFFTSSVRNPTPLAAVLFALDLALERMGANQIEILPVVSRADVHKVEGVLTLRDVLDSYGKFWKPGSVKGILIRSENRRHQKMIRSFL